MLDKYKDVTIAEPATLFDDYSGRELPARDQQMTVANHLTPLDLKLVPQPDQNARAAGDVHEGLRGREQEARGGEARRHASGRSGTISGS